MATSENKKLKVLIVDDEDLIRRALTRICQMKGYEVKACEDGVTGLEAWQEWKPDLVFLDIIMPRRNGFEVLKLKPKDDQAKVVLISAYTGEYDLSDPRQFGADLFIPKPFGDIFETLKEAEAIV